MKPWSMKTLIKWVQANRSHTVCTFLDCKHHNHEMITQEMENITWIGKWAKGRVLAPTKNCSFYKSFTSGHEYAGSAFCYIANDPLALFESLPDCKPKTCQGNLFSSYFAHWLLTYNSSMRSCSFLTPFLIKYRIFVFWCALREIWVNLYYVSLRSKIEGLWSHSCFMKPNRHICVTHNLTDKESEITLEFMFALTHSHSWLRVQDFALWQTRTE